MQTVGQLARQVGVSPDTLRYYEKRGLLAPARRSASGYRIYDAGALRRLRFICHARQSGFSRAEIRELLALRARASSRREDVRSVVLARKGEVDRRIAALQALSRALNTLLEQCAEGRAPLDGCPILAALETAEPTLEHADLHGSTRPTRRGRRAAGRVGSEAA